MPSPARRANRPNPASPLPRPPKKLLLPPPPKPFICTARRRRSARGCWRRCSSRSKATTALTCAVRPIGATPAPRPGARPRASARWPRCVSCWAWWARTNGAKRVWKCQRLALHRSTASTRTTACSRPCAANTWAWWPTRLCLARHWPLTLVWARGCCLPCWHAVGCSAWWPPTRTRAPWPARARACGGETLQRLGVMPQVELLQADLFPPGRAPLVVCNPPWVPARASSPIEHAVYDEGSRMLKGFLAGLADHLEPDGEGWLILSDLAEHLGLRPRAQLLEWIADAGLVVRGRHDVKPHHAKAADAGDALHAARAAEVTSLWRLAAA